MKLPLLLLGLGLLLAGCAPTTLAPPAALERPLPAGVVDHGRHASLLLGQPDGTVMRYSYGEWEWYALGRTGAGRAFGALLVPSEATLGRRILPGPLTIEAMRGQITEGFEHLHLFEVEADRALALIRRLDAMFEAGRAKTMVYNRSFGLFMVPIAESYWLGRSSNLVMAEWLEELGVAVEGSGVLSEWRLKGP